MISPLMSALLVLAAGQLGVTARKFTIANKCDATIWPDYMGDGADAITVDGKSGVGSWAQAAGKEVILEVPETCESWLYDT